MHKIKWKRGVVEYISCLVLLLVAMLAILDIFAQYNVRQDAEYALFKTARDVVVCNSKEKAEEMAEKELNNYIDTRPNLEYVSSSIEIVKGAESSTSGSTTNTSGKWQKGNFAKLYLCVKIRGLTTTKTRTLNYMFMVE